MKIKGNMKKIFNITILILWMILIFTMSNFKAVESDVQSGFIVNILSNIFHFTNINLITVIVRKLAHITEYLILGILMLNCLKEYNIKNVVIVSILVCILYSCSDEIHQIFISGRSGEVVDVLIDTIGIVLGNLIYKRIAKKYSNA